MVKRKVKKKVVKKTQKKKVKGLRVSFIDYDKFSKEFKALVNYFDSRDLTEMEITFLLEHYKQIDLINSSVRMSNPFSSFIDLLGDNIHKSYKVKLKK